MTYGASAAVPARPAAAVNFQDLVASAEPMVICRFVQRMDQAVVMNLGDRLTALTDQELALMLVLRMNAADKSIERFESMNKVIVEQKLQGAVDGRWRSTRPFALELVEQVIRLDRAFGGQNHFQHSASRRREPEPQLATLLLDLNHHLTGVHG